MIILAMLMQITAGDIPAPNRQEDIVVTGQNLQRAREALEACRTSRCPPDREIDAALSLATAQFLAGDYPEARRTVLATRHRVARYAKTYPVQVSRLMLADSRLQALDGRSSTARVSLIDALDAMRSGLPEQDARLLIAELRIGEGYAREGRWQPAAELYSKIAKLAAERGLIDIEANALFRRAALYAVLASRNPPFAESAAKAIAAVNDRQEAAFIPYRQGAAALKVRVASMNRVLTPDEASAMLPPGVTASAPVLVYEPRTARSDILDAARVPTAIGSGMPTTMSAGMNGAEPEWADLRFHIGRDGKVTDVEVVGQSAVKPGPWVSVAAKTIQSQRYLPLDSTAPTDGLEQRVRYSIVRSREVKVTGTRILQQSGEASLEITDLSMPVPTQPVSKS